ncbi:tryptophan synthase subunit alpha [Streptomyces meridianus]|uniref:tryptophan synthase n=1 Tax=Streptomyces meridianus TaxID=2938945 RepID=A0ABT0XB01_9ACTN|nr:tryptophan synthase subunit alpha [Streptomyces meridianus]MCM2579682.1 tryptophan synthase subunit alpha [Streptomyces meridianus]
MTYDVHVRDAANQASNALRIGLDSTQPALGTFSVAGYPDLRSSVETFVAFAQNGATVLEVGAPAQDPWLDGPVIAAAHRRALRRGDGVSTTLETVRQVSTLSDRPVVTMIYWATVLAYGPERMARELASVGAAGCLVPDVPPGYSRTWAMTAVEHGITAPLLADRGVSRDEMSATCRAARGFIYAPAATGKRTGYLAGIDLASLASFVGSARRIAPTTPVLTGIGISTPELAAAAVQQCGVAGVVIGSPLVRALTDGGLDRAIPLVERFAASLNQAGRARVGLTCDEKP